MKFSLAFKYKLPHPFSTAHLVLSSSIPLHIIARGRGKDFLPGRRGSFQSRKHGRGSRLILSIIFSPPCQSLLFLCPLSLVLLLLLLIFFFHCCLQKTVLISTHDLYLLCLQLSPPSWCSMERERKTGEREWVACGLVGSIIPKP